MSAGIRDLMEYVISTHHNIKQCITVQNSAMKYTIVQYSTVQYSAVCHEKCADLSSRKVPGRMCFNDHPPVSHLLQSTLIIHIL